MGGMAGIGAIIGAGRTGSAGLAGCAAADPALTIPASIITAVICACMVNVLSLRSFLSYRAIRGYVPMSCLVRS
jgi:ABC-type proline/glycine betaine transport system permease subunit